MSILVIGGTGTVGGETVRSLAAKGEAVRVMSRSAERLEELPPGARGVVGDLARPDTLPAALEGVERLCLITPLSPNEADEGKAAVAAAQAAGVTRLVYMSVHRVEECPEAPHFASKIEIQKAIEASGVPFTVIRPNNFFQNDFWFREVMVDHGVYPQPIGEVGLSRVDVRDIADALVNALLEDGHDGQVYPLVGPDILTGAETARIWGRHLGREVRYGGDDLEAWAAQARQGMPDWLVEDLAIMYRFFQQRGLKATAEELARQQEILGHPPLSFHRFAEETAWAWRDASAAV